MFQIISKVPVYLQWYQLRVNQFVLDDIATFLLYLELFVFLSVQQTAIVRFVTLLDRMRFTVSWLLVR